MNWKCDVCGYIHEGDVAPESCPLCNVSGSKFSKNEGEASEKIASALAAEKVAKPNGEEQKQWRCSVCGYVHDGEDPPDECPLCHVSKEKFVLVGSEEDQRIAREKEKKQAAAKKRAEERAAAKSAAGSEKKKKIVTKLRCIVCGYIHDGQTPPESCPVCGVEKDKFVPLEEEEVVAPENNSSATGATGESRHWKCKVCQYIHEGEKPPAKCPICGAGAGAFVEVDASGISLKAEDESAEEEQEHARRGVFGVLNNMIVNFHIHPIMAHFPNGILPVVVVFLAIGLIWNTPLLESAAYYNLVAILVTLPVVIYAGFVAWQRTYMGAKTFVFITKIICGFVVFASVAALVLWPLFQPGVNSLKSGQELVIGGTAVPCLWIYLGIALVGLGAAGIAGHLGGNLVFGKKR